MAEVVAIAAEIEATPAQVALAWLLARPGVVVPIIGATKEHQMEQNLGCLDVKLDDAQMERLEQVSAIELGSPHDFLRSPAIKQIVYGDDHQLVDDRRSTVRRAPADDVGVPHAAGR